MQPIWKDYYIDLGASEYADYEVQVSAQTIFTGRAYRRPGEATIRVKINDIAADYLAELLPASGGVVHFDLARTFSIYKGSTLVESVDFYNDWSYDFSFDPDTMPLAVPIDYLDPRQWLIRSVLSFGTMNAVLTFADGTTQTIPLALSSTGSFSPAFSLAYDAITPDGPGAMGLDLSLYPGVVSVTIAGVTYPVKESCARYAVYYINAYGGWDSLVVSAKRTDELTRHSARFDYDNSVPSNRGAKDYAVEVSPTWELTTDWLNGEQCAKMHHLLNSPVAYLYDLVEQTFIPVVLTNTSTEHKQRFSNYTFTARLARDQYRR